MFEKFVRDASGSPGLAKDKILSPIAPTLDSSARPQPTSTRHIALKVHLHEKLLTMLNLSVLDKITRDELRRELAPLIRTILSEDGIALNTIEYHQLVDEVLDEVLGLGPLEPFLKDPTVSDVLVNTHKQVFVERAGRLEQTPARFKDERHLIRVIQKIVSAVGRGADASQPWVYARSEEHTSELQSPDHLVCRLLLEKK